MGEPVTRDDLYFPKIAEASKIWTFTHDLTGAVALWAVKQSPYPCPEGLEVVIKKLHESIASDFTGRFNMKEFTAFVELEMYLRSHLRGIPEYMAWNERKNGNQDPFSFTSRYDGPKDPDNDFVSLEALERNAAMHVVQQSVLNNSI